MKKQNENEAGNPGLTESFLPSGAATCYASWVRSMTIRGFVKAMNRKMPMPYPCVRALCDKNGIEIAGVSLTKPVRLATRISVRHGNDGNDGTARVIRIFPA
jgi:hypothetical protein